MSASAISWKLPWRPLQFEAEIPGVQRQLEKEIGPLHPLWGKDAQVIGRRIDCDDVVVSLNDGTYACVHLVWGSEQGAFPAEYPSFLVYRTLEEFLAAMRMDAEEYGDEI